MLNNISIEDLQNMIAYEIKAGNKAQRDNDINMVYFYAGCESTLKNLLKIVTRYKEVN